MKILLVNYKYAYDREWNNLDRRASSYYLEYLPLKAVAEKYGHYVDIFFFDEAILNKGRTAAREELWEYISKIKPDVCFAGFNEADWGTKLFKKMRDQKFTTFVYIGDDDTWRWERFSRHYAKYFTWILTYDSRAVKKYKSIGCTNIVHHQPGVDLVNYHKISGLPKDIDVSFIGGYTLPREKLINDLKHCGIDVFVRGIGWPGGPVSHNEMINIFNRSKIVLSLNTSAFYINWRSISRLFFRRANLGEGGISIKLDIWNFGDNVRSWIMKRNRQVKARHFEVPACGSMEMTQDADDLKDYYELGKEIVVYKDVRDLVEKIKYYFAHPEERERIAQRGYERTLREHSTGKRFEEIFARIGHPMQASA